MKTPRFSRVQCLMIYVRRHAEEQRGRKAALARYLGVRPHMVSAWLDDKDPVQPNAEHALGMVEWLQKQQQPRPPQH